MCEINWTDHVIDLGVIFLADVFAAFFAIRVFEARRSDRERTESSLNQLYQLGSRLKIFYERQRARIAGTADHLHSQISGDMTDERQQWGELKDDLLFWSFNTGTFFENQYKAISDKMATSHTQLPVTDLRTHLNELSDLFKKILEAIVTELKPPEKKWWQIWK